MNVFQRKLLLLLLSVVASGAVMAEDSGQAREWLERMATAMSQLNYQGTFIYMRDGGVETMRITHVTDQDGVRERLYSLSGPHREVIRDKRGVRCILKDTASVVEDPVIARSFFPELPLSVIDNKSSGYRLETRGSARIAGHKARRVSVSPEDSYRYGYDFWLEEQTGLLLKWVLLDTSQKILAKVIFTDFSMGADVDWDELESDSNEQDFVELKTFSPVKTVVTQSKPRWQPGKLPPGFSLSLHSHHQEGGGVFEHTVYSDGLAAVSVYVEEQGRDTLVKQGTSHLGTNNAYSTKQNGLQITVIGEVPVITVESIANQIALSVAAK